MRILVLNYEYPPVGGGAGRVTQLLAQGYVQAGHEVDVVTSGVTVGVCVEQGCTIHRIVGRVSVSKSTVVDHLLYVGAARRFLQNTRDHYDVCHIHGVVPTGLLGPYLKGIPYSITAHGSDVPGFNLHRFTTMHRFCGPMWRYVVLRSKGVYVASSMLQYLIAQQGYHADIIVQGVGSPYVCPKRRSIIGVGRFTMHKGFHHLIEAVSQLDYGYELHLVGEGPMMFELKKLAKKSRMRIVFHGWLDPCCMKYRFLLGSSRLFVLPSAYENASVALTEAMAHKCAIIADGGEGGRQLLGDVGCHVDYGDVDGLRSSIVRVIEDTRFQSQLMKDGFKRYQKYYTAQDMVKRYLAVLENIM